MNNLKNQQWCFDTLCVHAGEGVDTDTKAIRRPIHMANCYAFPTDITELLETLSWEHLDKLQYTREHSPTPRHLEERLAVLEGGQDCIVTASGMGAIAATFFTLLNAGDHIVASEVSYTGTQKLLGFHLPRFGVDVSLVDTTDLKAVSNAIRKDTKVVYVETPGNPVIGISDIEKISEMAHVVGATMIVDSTWSGLVNQHPFSLGADIVIHSATKFIDGQGRVLGGLIVSNQEHTEKMFGFLIIISVDLVVFFAYLSKLITAIRNVYSDCPYDRRIKWQGARHYSVLSFYLIILLGCGGFLLFIIYNFIK